MNDEEFQQAVASFEVYKAQLDALSQQSGLFKLSLENAVMARDTLKMFASSKEGDKILVPIGASSFITAVVTSEKKAIVGIGNKISIDMNFDEATTYMAANADEISEALKKLNETIQKINTEARKLSLVIQQEYQRRQQ
ncbi:MAG: prefoldin subunit alpha [archaeon]|nr:prefoldin subunit alpha [archaeon]